MTSPLILSLLMLISITLFAFSSVYGKILIEEMRGESYYLFVVMNLMTTMILIVVGVILFFSSSLFDSLYDLRNLVLIFCSSMLSLLGFILILKGFEKGNASVGGMLLSMRVVISVPLAFFFLNDVYPFITYVFILIALIGAIYVGWEQGFSWIELITLKSPGSKHFAAGCISWALSNVFIGELGPDFPTIMYIIMRAMLFTVVGVASFPLMKKILGVREKFHISRRILTMISPYVLVLLFAQFLLFFVIGQSVTLAESIGVFEGIITFVIATCTPVFISRLSDTLDEPTNRKTLIVRSIAATIATLGTLGVVISAIV